MMGYLQRTILAALILTGLLAGCSSGGPIGDTLPSSMGGLPQGAPARPNAANRQYPAVYDMPAARPTTPLSEDDQVKLEKDLQAIRDRQAAAAAADGAPAPVAPKGAATKPGATKSAATKPVVKKQTDTKAAGTNASGAKTSGTSPNP